MKCENTSRIIDYLKLTCLRCGNKLDKYELLYEYCENCDEEPKTYGVEYQ